MKKFGFAFGIRDWKETFTEVSKYCKKISKKIKNSSYEDVDTNWDDCIRTIITNHPKINSLINELGEDVFIATDAIADKNGIVWFDDIKEFKKIIKESCKLIEQEYEQDDKEYEQLQTLGVKGKKIHEKFMKNKDVKQYNEKKLKLPKRFMGWSINSIATYLTIKQLTPEFYC